MSILWRIWHSAPSSIQVSDLNGDQRPDLIILVPRNAGYLYLQQEDHTFTAGAVDATIRKGLLTDIAENQIGFADTNQDGITELIVAYQGFARAAYVSLDGNLKILDQFNARSSQDTIQAPLLFDLDRDGRQELLFYNADDGTLQLLQRDAAMIFRYKAVKELGMLSLVSARLLRGPDNVPQQIAFLGKDRF